MEVAPPTKVKPLQRLRAGSWRTRDGLWDIVLDPTEHPSLGIGGDLSPRRVWYIYPTKGRHPSSVNPDLPAFVGEERAWACRRDAVEALEDAKMVDVEPAG